MSREREGEIQRERGREGEIKRKRTTSDREIEKDRNGKTER